MDKTLYLISDGGYDLSVEDATPRTVVIVECGSDEEVAEAVKKFEETYDVGEGEVIVNALVPPDLS